MPIKNYCQIRFKKLLLNETNLLKPYICFIFIIYLIKMFYLSDTNAKEILLNKYYMPYEITEVIFDLII